MTVATLPNGAGTTNTYDNDARLTQTTTQKAGQTLESFGYTYDLAGNRTSMTDRLGQQTTYAHDALNRLTAFDPPADPPTNYSYDPAGNRTGAGAATYSFDALNRLTGSSDGTSFAYDGAGRLASKTKAAQTTTYAWDLLDQLTGVDNGSNPITYSYDGLGRRSERTEASQTETAHYGDLTDRPILDTAPGGSIVRSRVSGAAGLAEERTGSTTAYPVADGHGDVTAVLDASGAVSSRQSYDPWGAQLSGPALEMGYLGAYQRRSDPDAGLAQMGVRAYDPGLGRFLSEDPALGYRGLSQSINRYAYTYDNPLNLYDLDGRSAGYPPGGFIRPPGSGGGGWDGVSFRPLAGARAPPAARQVDRPSRSAS